MLFHVDLEALAIAAILPVGDFIPEAIQKGAATEVNPADEHAAQMAEVADSIASGSQGEEELDGGHGGNERPHGDHDGEREDPNAPIRKEDGIRDEDAINCAGRADGWSVAGQMSPNHGEGLNQNRNQSGANSAQEKIIQKAVCAPSLLQFAAKHPQEEHVDEQMEKAAMKEDVCNGLPDAEAGDWSQRHKPQMIVYPEGRVAAEQNSSQGLQKENNRTGNNQVFDARSDEAAPVEADARRAERRAHESSVR